ncbi:MULTISPECIES: oligosaccharide flippase family protein [unclassified Campylobacter]|uniref:oligosaccharide flippase family protein n=1 Tax=unclassified Campylobacter TaxID=2593542 RepID=UPI0022E9D54C|nr:MULTISPECIES: oligosaccharide flippase family protein [unclassified Campylobacter]MDA3079232.1 oligosaccharide flippase family protein [Campylobacter sp. CS_NA2]MDA3080465.1 oligosaccharide flippase family protein [Campylobacter sp. CS_NA1]MDA3085330.1 oligosaccharide flippase family protein [Campylobacter sp. CS_ED1]MDA3090107.1 oligosaccharide flippase family protein [Campylobacter sp. CS_ED2]WBR51355.1 oligosaccharide flippase family protein [Campylobacter sp. CS_NA3]
MAINPKIVKNIAWLLCEHGVRIVMGLAVTMILARVLSVEEYGNFQYILGLVVIFSALSYINPAEIVVPRLTNADAVERKIIMGNGFVIRFVSSVIAYIALLAFVYFTDDIKIFYLSIVMASSILVNEAFAIITAYLQSQTMIKYRVILTITTHIFNLLMFLTLYYLDVTNIYAYGFVTAFEWFLIAFGLLVVYRILTKEWFFTYDKAQIFKFLKLGLPFFAGIILMIICRRVDLMFLKHLGDDFSLGLYASAMSLLKVATAIAPIVSISFAPLFVYKFDDIKIIKSNVLKLACGIFIGAILTSVILYFLAPLVINLIFGAKFNGTIPVFKFLLLVLPFIFLDTALNIYIIKMQFGKILIYKWALVLLFSSLGYIIFIPKFLTYGAIIGYGSGYLVACLFGLWVIFRYKKNGR